MEDCAADFRDGVTCRIFGVIYPTLYRYGLAQILRACLIYFVSAFLSIAVVVAASISPLTFCVKRPLPCFFLRVLAYYLMYTVSFQGIAPRPVNRCREDIESEG
jgi:hypothetical protein